MIIVSSYPYQSGVPLILWGSIRLCMQGQEAFLVASMGSSAVLLLFNRVMHTCNLHIASELDNMLGGLACARMTFMGGIESTGIAIPPVIVSLHWMGRVVALP